MLQETVEGVKMHKGQLLYDVVLSTKLFLINRMGNFYLIVDLLKTRQRLGK